MTENDDRRDMLPVEAEIDMLKADADLDGGDIVALATARADATIAVHKQLMRTTVAMTMPADWLKMGAHYFLQSKGCERIAPLWQVQFEPLSLKTDVQLEMFPGPDGTDEVQWTVCLTGTCKRTGRTETDISEASSADGFFSKDWANSRDNPVRRKMISNEIRKAAITHCRGRVIRNLIGLNGVEGDWLAQHGMDLGRTTSVDYKKGARGGESEGAQSQEPSEGQLKKLAMCFSHHIEDCTYDKAMAWLGQGRSLTKTNVSNQIDKLEKRDAEKLGKLKQGPILKWLGLPVDDPASTSEGAVDTPKGGGEPQPIEGTDPSIQCVYCERSWSVIATNDHGKGCPKMGEGFEVPA